ncbi:MAG: carboxypeptidase M32 [Chitinophagaceae bacterium]|nr:carboxypeptidase M32 [Chitinophagaceae bacterium]
MITLSSPDLFQQFRNEMQKIADFRYASAVLQWDQETYLPPKGAAMRGRQVATLSETAHQAFVAPQLGDLIHALLDRSDLTLAERRNVELVHEDYLKQQKLPSSFVRKLAETTQRSFHSWIAARKENDFRLFADDLNILVDMKRQEAAMLGYLKHPYDALLNDHDKGSDTDLLDALFSDVRQPLKELLDKIVASPEVDDSFLRQHFPKQAQWDFGMQLLKDLGYDLEAGRQDLAEHPFTINFNSNDVRITTRIDENDLSNMVWSCIHEVGHALYEQGLPESEYGMPLGEAASYSIHESQSRLWENHVGRSLEFCEHYWPLLQQYFPSQLGKVTAEQFYRAINKVQPSLIRTDADELTYHFHVMVRYEIEKKLIENSIQTEDIPAYWNEHYQRYLGVNVPDDKRGCLQDIHWSHGSFGYFPTYSQGSFYAAQLFGKASKDITKLPELIRNGENQPLLGWLRKNVHQYGRMYKSEELCSLVTGDGLKIHHFLDYMLAKYSNIYQF